MNIVGEGFPDEVIDQIKVRQKILGSINKTDEQLVWMNAKTGWVRMASSVDLKEQKRNLTYKDDELARAFVLFGGVEYQTYKGPGDSVLLPELQTYNKRAGIWPGGGAEKNNYAYGIGGTDFGLRPMPGITSAEIKTETRGSLKTATIQLMAYNQQQFDIIDLLYMRLGYSMLLEWGHSTYYTNGEVLEDSNKNSLAASFLSGQMNYDNYLDKIAENRKKSNGNYDAIVGKVVNFNWTFNPDMSYSITITLRSMGDVIESLKANILLPNIPPIDNTSTSNNTTIPEENSTEIGRFFNRLKKRIDTTTTPSTIGLSRLTSTNPIDTGWDGNDKSTIFVKQVYASGEKQYYIKLARFLSFLEKEIIPNVDIESVKLLKINNRVTSNLIYMHPYQISSDPTICNFKTELEDDDGNIYYFLPDCDQFKFELPNKNIYGLLMNVYINVDYINNKLIELKDDNGKVSLYELLNVICKGYSNSTGNKNQIEPTINSETGEIIFIDQTPLPDRDELLKELKLQTKTAEFNVYKLQENNGSFIRNFNFNTTISNNLATMITVGATSNGYVLGEDATVLSRMNRGIEDRFKKNIFSPGSSPLLTAIQSNFNTNDYKEPREAFREFVLKLGIKGKTEKASWDEETITLFKSLQNQLLEYFQNQSTNNSLLPLASSPTITGFLPFDLQLTMEGLSGFKIYQKYTINSEFLPSNYPESLEFIVKGITNKIDKNEWTTTIESLAIPKNPTQDNSSFLNQLLNNLTRPPTPNNTYPIASSIQYSNIEFTSRAANDRINPNLLNDINQAAKNKGLRVRISVGVTGHAPLTSSGNVSRHVVGNAIDIDMINGEGSNNASSTNIGNRNFRINGDLLKNELVDKLGYTWNTEEGKNKSILWKTNVGGNHYNHLHISNII